jgi:hypothetical protein
VTGPVPAGAPLPVWPFLVSRGILLGYRVVVAPEFLVTTGEAHVVFSAAEDGPGVSRTGPMLRVVQTAAGDPLTLVYRRRPAALGEPGTPLLRDQYGRPFSMIEGYAVRGAYQRVPVTEEQWQDLHRVLLTEYRQFLDSESADPLLIAAQGGSLDSAALAAPESNAPPQPPTSDRASTRLIIIMLTLLAIAVLLALLLAR